MTRDDVLREFGCKVSEGLVDLWRYDERAMADRIVAQDAEIARVNERVRELEAELRHRLDSRAFYTQLEAAQRPFDADARKVLHDNLWSLLAEPSDAATPPSPSLSETRADALGAP